MKRIFTIVLFALFSTWATAQSLSQPPFGDNQRAKVTQFVGMVEVTVAYSSPDVHAPNGDDRKGHIWGELVHYGFIDQGFGSSKAAPWRAGANENTTITFSHDVKVEGKDLKAGTYGLFLALDKTSPWTWIFSKNSTSWGSYFYNQNEDALRVQVNPQDAVYTEWLTFGFEDRQTNSTVAYLQWENKKISFKIEVPNVNDIYVTQMRNEFRSSTGFNTRNFSTAAAFCVQHKINLDEALVWANSAMNPTMGGQEDFNSLQVKSTVLQSLGREAEANEAMDKAIKKPDATVGAIHQFAKTLLAAGKKEKAMEIFRFNAQQHPEDKFTTNVGLARGYTAMDDKKNAIKHWELAIKNIPDSQKSFIATYEGELKKVKEGK